METMTVKIGGMSCGHCVQAVRKELAKMAGVEIKEVGMGSARVEVDPAKSSRSAVEEAIVRAGYTVEKS